MRVLFTGDINFRGKDKLTFEESKNILSEIKCYLESPLADKVNTVQ